MIYLLAIVLSLIVCCQCFASEITAGNIRHLEHGRAPNAGAAIFPLIPVAQLLAVGTAWLLDAFFPRYAIVIVFGAFLLATAGWAWSFARLQSQFRKAKSMSRPDPF